MIAIDVLLAGDNAVVIGTLASGLERSQRNKVIAVGTLAALVLRIFFTLTASQIMQVSGVLLIGGILLIWIAWKMWRELSAETPEAGEAKSDRTLIGAIWAVAIADLSMSPDNVVAVAGAAREHVGVLVIGLIMSIAIIGLGAGLIANLIQRYRWIGRIGVALIVLVAMNMLYHGVPEVVRLL